MSTASPSLTLALAGKILRDCCTILQKEYKYKIDTHSDSITLSEKELLGLIRDNPAGQGRQCTPLILIREKKAQSQSV